MLDVIICVVGLAVLIVFSCGFVLGTIYRYRKVDDYGISMEPVPREHSVDPFENRRDHHRKPSDEGELIP